MPGSKGAGAASGRSTVLWLASLAPLGFVVFILGLALGVRGTDVDLLAMGIVTALITAIPPILDRGRDPQRRHLLLALLAIGYSIFFVVPVFTLYIPAVGPTYPLGTAVFPKDILRAQFSALVGLLSLLVGYAVPVGRGISALLPRLRHDWTLSGSLAVALVMLPLGWALELATRAGFVPSRVGSGLLGALAGSTFFGIALLTIAYLRYRSRLTFTLLAVIVPLTMFFNFFTGSKGRFLLPLALVVVTWILYERRFRIRWILAGFAAVILLYPAAMFYREVVLEGNTRSPLQVIAHPWSALSRVSGFVSTYEFTDYLKDGFQRTTGRFDGLGRATIIIRDTPGRVPYQKGWTLGYIFLAYIPRVIWANKPSLTIGQWVTDNYGPGPQVRSATGPTWIGEFYLNFGDLGVIVGMGIIGIVLRLLHESLFRDITTIPGLLAGSVVLAAMVPGIGGGILSSVNRVTFSLGPLLVTHFFLRQVGGTRAQPAGAQAPSEAPALGARTNGYGLGR